MSKVTEKRELTKPHKSIRNLVIISDLHCGCRLGLCPSYGVVLDEGGKYMPSNLQKKVWDCWQRFWGFGKYKNNGWVKKASRGEPFAVVLNGDAIDGVHHKSVTQISHNLQDQIDVAYEVMAPVVELCDGQYYHIRGTEAHSGASCQEEEKLARKLGAIPIEQTKQHSRWEMNCRLGKALVNISHHISTCGSLQYESTALNKELAESLIEACRWNKELPDCIVRSHRHRNTEVRITTYKGLCTVCTTAGWQLKTPFARRIVGARQSSPQIGGTLLRYGDDGVLYAKHMVWPIVESKIVQL